MKSKRALVALAILGLLSACAMLPDSHVQAPQRSAKFDLLGRVLVVYGAKAFSSNMRWLHTPQRDELWLLTPTGQALAHIIDSATGATLTATDQTAYHAGSVESLTQRALGWELPLARLQYWVRGAPVPGMDVAVAQRDDHGRLVKLSQGGWQVSYTHNTPSEQDGQPRRLELVKGTDRIRLVIDSWRREPAQP